jgi:hypothetical protein
MQVQLQRATLQQLCGHDPNYAGYDELQSKCGELPQPIMWATNYSTMSTTLPMWHYIF